MSVKCMPSVCFLIFISLLIAGCHKSSGPAPFFDGLYLKYHEVFESPVNPGEILWARDIEYRFTEAEGGAFHVSQTVSVQRDGKRDTKFELIPYPQVGDDLTVDENGKAIKGGDDFNFPEGYLSYL